MNETNSKTQKFLFQHSYRKHRQRLADIRHNSTSHQLKLPPRHKAQDKKRLLMQRIKQEQIQSQNSILQQKIQQIHSRASNCVALKILIQPNYTQAIRYDESCNTDKIHIEQGKNPGENFKLIVPGQKARALSFTSKNKNSNFPWVKYDIINRQENTNKKHIYTSSSKKRVESFNATYSQKSFGQKKNHLKKDILISYQPQRNQQRQVLHKRTIILSQNQSCLLELSLLQDQMLIAAYLMGIQNNCVKKILNAKKTEEIVREYQSNYDQFCQKVTLQKVNNQYQIIKLPHKQIFSKVKDKVSNQDKAKQKIKLQNQFLKRNYYTLLKNQQDANSSSKNQPTITHQKVQEIVQRLSAPKKYISIENQAQKQVKNLQINKISKPLLQSKLSIHYQGQLLPKKNNLVKIESTFMSSHLKHSINQIVKSQQNKGAKLSLQKTDSFEFQRQNQSSPTKLKQKYKQQTEINHYENQYENPSFQAEDVKGKQQQEEVEYLDGDQYEQGQFQNASALLKSIDDSKHQSNKNSLCMISSVTKQFNKQEILGIKKPLAKLQQSHEYRQEFDQQQQNYEQVFQVQQKASDLLKSSQVPQANPLRTKTKQVDEQQYEQQFET